MNCEFTTPLDGYWQCPRCTSVVKNKTTWKKCGEVYDYRLHDGSREASTGGPGSKLKEWLKSHGIAACQRCVKLAEEMDTNKVEWCRENLDYLVEEISKNVAAMSVIEQEDWRGKAKVAALKMSPAKKRRELIRAAVIEHALS